MYVLSLVIRSKLPESPDCASPPSTPGASVSYNSTSYGSTATYTCDDGFMETGGDVSVSCDTEDWIGTPLTCSLVGNTFCIPVL